MAQASIFQQILDPANRDDPYPLFAELRRTPVTREADGSHVVSTYREIVALLHDPRVRPSQPHRAGRRPAHRRGGSAGTAAGLHPPRSARARPAAGAGRPAVRAAAHPRPG